MSGKGWASVHRQITDHWVWDCEFSTGQAWVDLILGANHKPAKISIKGQLIELDRGQQARSEVTLSKQWKWSRNKVRRFLKNLENDGMIERKTTHLTSVISICNYSGFQDGDTADGTAKGQQTEQLKDSRRNTDNNVNNENNGNNKVFLDSERIIPIWNSLGCKQHRGITKAAEASIRKTYKEYSKSAKKGGSEPREINDWLEIYLKNGFTSIMTSHHQDAKDGQWSADLEFATRPATYDKVKNYA